MAKKRFIITTDELVGLIHRGHVVETGLTTGRGIPLYLDVETPEGRATGEDLLRLRGVKP